MSSSNQLTEDVYNAIPVHYCKQCLSLRIKGLAGNSLMDFCDDCNSTDILTTDIFTWEKMYEERYGINYLKQNKNGRKESY